MPHKPGNGAIFGIVSEDGLAKAGSPVYLYDTRRDVGVGDKRLLAKRLTKSDGGFSFAGLDTGYTDYMLLATDEDGVEPKNALVQDRVQPIAAHSGSGMPAAWYANAMRDGAQVGFITWPVRQDGSGEPVPRGLFGRPVQNNTYPVTWPPHPAPPPEIPNMAALQFNPAGWGPFCRGRAVTATDAAASLEVMLDLDTIASQEGDCIIGGFQSAGSTTTSHGGTFSRLGDSATAYMGTLGYNRISEAKLLLQLSNSKVVTAQVSVADYSATAYQWDGFLSTLGSVDLAAYSGVVHLIVSFTPTSSVKFFVNGALVHTANTSDEGATSNLYLGAGYTVFGFTDGTTSNNRTLQQHVRNYICALGVYYNQSLTNQQAEDHYKALYNNDLISVVSGYAQEVFADTPHMYWRMDDFDALDRHSFASDVNWRDPNTGTGEWATRLELIGSDNLVEPNATSPIAGRNTVGVVHLNGNFFSAERAGTFGWLFRDRGSFSCWAKFDLATPAVAEFLAEFDMFNSTEPYFDVCRITDGKLRVRLREGGATNTYTFNYIPPQNDWQYIAIIIDKTGETDGELRLYVGDESTQPTLQQTILIPLLSLYTVVGFETATTASYPIRVQTMRQLTGSLCELAMFPEVLTLDRIQAHWTAKDVV